MADFVLTAEEVGNVVQFVAPGYFVRAAYRARFPQSETATLNMVVWSVAASLPLVALGNSVADKLSIDHVPTDWEYVAALLLPSLLIGYLAALLRSVGWVRRALGAVGLHHQPDGSLYALTMLQLSASAPVTLELQDGRILSGTPRAGPSFAEDDVDEVVLTNPAWRVADGSWSAEGAGKALLVPLREVKSVTFAEDPFA